MKKKTSNYTGFSSFHSLSPRNSSPSFLQLSNSCVHTHNELEAVVDGLEQVFPVVDLDVEFVFECVVDQHARLNVHLVEFVVPVRAEGYRDAVPALRVRMSQPITDYLDYALRQNMRLLLQVNVVLVGVVKRARQSN